ncbi:MAG: hydantoinase/oxoprolinase family protein [Desulfovibrio sp.]|nr:hydantoinase/oxoprolinase family protein [Desulfovibrio sp.]
MPERVLLGIDAGGTHTDAVLIVCEGKTLACPLQAKVATNHQDLPSSIRHVLAKLANDDKNRALLSKVSDVTLGTTLAVNALVQGKTSPVGLLLTAGPGLAPERFALGDAVATVPGGLDHRGVEVTPLDCSKVASSLAAWKSQGIEHVACVGKFSPRTPDHELALGQCVQDAGLRVSYGHRLSGQLNFPRRIATAFYNAAVEDLHARFLDAVESVLAEFGIHAVVRLLKADGGAVPVKLSRQEPVQSILSGPAASVMGILALTPEVASGTSLLLDIGGTTTDMAVIVDGSPVIDRNGMLLQGRRTLVRALASLSIGVGGDSRLTVTGSDNALQVTTGPMRDGNAMAFGGERPTLLDAINTIEPELAGEHGDRERSQQGLEALAKTYAADPLLLARLAVENAVQKISRQAQTLLASINAHPIYTLKALRSQSAIYPERLILVGGPSDCLKARLAEAFKLPVIIPDHADVANAVGAALTRPTASLEVYADSGKRQLRAPRLDHSESLERTSTLRDVKERALALLSEHLAAHGMEDVPVEVLEADLFATLDDYGTSSRDMRVTCQAQPGIAGTLSHADCAL